MKFRKRPVVIDAVQWFRGHIIDGMELFDGEWGIRTLEGFMFISDGDWIITGVKGEKYPCKPDIFALTYEPVTP